MLHVSCYVLYNSRLTLGLLYSILVSSMIKQRVNRIIGQLLGIERMVDEKRDCSDILQQISAIKKAIDSLSKEVVVSGVCRYIAKENTKEVEKVLERAINI